MEDLTIIYYTANTEDETFENKIRENIVEQAKGLPIVSVSRKPIKFGHNICVGEKPVSYINSWKQLLLGLKEAKTKFCIATESDCLYPPDYFSFRPPSERQTYQYDNVWVVWKYKYWYWKKYNSCEGAQICGREYWIERLEAMLSSPETNTRKLVQMIFPDYKTWTGEPVVTFKTRDGINGGTGYIRESSQKEIPYWGEINKLKEKMFV